MMKRLSASDSAQRGGAAVEAALLVFPMLLLLVFGIAEGGRLFFQYNTIAKSTRDAARYLSTVAPGSGHADATCLVITGTPDCTGSPLVEGLAPANVAICDATNCAGTHRNVPVNGNSGPTTGVMNLVTVTVTGFRPLPFIGVAMPGVEFGDISITMRQAL